MNPESLFTGKKVRLRAYEREDLNLARAYVNHPEVGVNLATRFLYPLRKEDEDKWYESTLAANDGTYHFAVERLEDSQYIGGCGINEFDIKSRVATVGIFLGPEYLNQGYGSEAMRLFINFGFLELNLNKLRLFVFSFNKRAIASYKKLGYIQEGILRQEIFRHGEYHDVIAMGMLVDEWKAAYQPSL
jgi:RimJ/RimL family protein N-acetyltransferase